MQFARAYRSRPEPMLGLDSDLEKADTPARSVGFPIDSCLCSWFPH